MNAHTVNDTNRGIYVGSFVARIDSRDMPVEWRQAANHDVARELADALAEAEPEQKFVVYDQYLEPGFADCFG